MKLRPDNLRGFILTAETEYEKNILNCFGGLWFTSCHGVGGDMILRVTSKTRRWMRGKTAHSLQQPQAQNLTASVVIMSLSVNLVRSVAVKLRPCGEPLGEILTRYFIRRWR